MVHTLYYLFNLYTFSKTLFSSEIKMNPKNVSSRPDPSQSDLTQYALRQVRILGQIVPSYS